jgi:hypothetical protein
MSETERGISSNIVLVIVGVLIIAGVLVLPLLTDNVDTSPEMQTEEEIASTTPEENSDTEEEVSSPVAPTTPKPSQPKPPQPSTEETTTQPEETEEVVEPPATTIPPPPVEETPPPQTTWDPGFQANVRVTPEIPSENERATLPACNGHVFTSELVQLSNVASITSSGTFGAASNPPSFAILNFGTSGQYDLYDVFAPGDVYVTNIVQETGITSDPEDTTVYFALCRDVIGYVTNIKEMSSGIYKMVTDSYCLGKPHTGPNACKIEILEQVSAGSLIGKTGRLGGKLGFGVIDLRENQNLTNPQNYPIKTNFAACPFDYLLYSSGFYAKLTSGNELCQKP